MATTDEPNLRRTPSGWLATSRGDFPRVGVIAPTAALAAERFRAERAEWRRLRAMDDGDRDR